MAKKCEACEGSKAKRRSNGWRVCDTCFKVMPKREGSTLRKGTRIKVKIRGDHQGDIGYIEEIENFGVLGIQYVVRLSDGERYYFHRHELRKLPAKK